MKHLQKKSRDGLLGLTKSFYDEIKTSIGDNNEQPTSIGNDSSGIRKLKKRGRATGERDVKFKVMYCGICHSDLHMLKNEWGVSTYPLVPGHEIVGIVIEVGNKVEKFKTGDRVGVGCMVGSCDNCAKDLENYCPKMILTYGVKYHNGTITYGGYSDLMVADEHFVVRIPDNLPLDAVASLLCAGITVYSPLRLYVVFGSQI